MAEFLIGLLALGGGVFGASAGGKLHGRRAFREYCAGLRATRLLPGRLLSNVAVVLVAAEAAVACSLTGAGILVAAGDDGYVVAEAALAAAVMVTTTLVAGVALVLRRGTRVPCRCFGSGPARPLGPAHLVRNAGLLALLLAGLAVDAGWGAGSGVATAGRPGVAGTVLAVGAGLIAASLVARWDDLAVLFSSSA